MLYGRFRESLDTEQEKAWYNEKEIIVNRNRREEI